MDQVVFEGKRAILNTLPGGPGTQAYAQGEKTVAEVTQAIGRAGHTLLPWSLGLAPVGLPLRAVYSRNGQLVFLVECAPGLYTMPWIDESRKKQGYRDVQIAVPYTVFFIGTTHGGNLLNSSVYFRTAPLTASDFSDPLCDPHFLNCSVRAYGVYCWICYVRMRAHPEPGESLLEFVAACVKYFWDAPFNRSSEQNEGQSFFGKGCGVGKPATPIPDARVRSIEAWEAASAADPRFALTVPWTPAGRTVADVFRELTRETDMPWPFTSAGDLGNLIVQKRRK